MKKNESVSKADSDTNRQQKTDLPGYKSYPPKDDIFTQFSKVKNILPEDVQNITALNEKDTVGNALPKLLPRNSSGQDMDVPGSELDDAQEAIGNEDEENNYYSLCGDDHNDLEEYNGS